jgi:hypothetical protein
MANQRKLLGCNFHRLTIADGSYSPVTSVGRGWADGSYDGSFCWLEGPMKVRAFEIIFVGS